MGIALVFLDNSGVSSSLTRGVFLRNTRYLAEPVLPVKELENPVENAPLAGTWLKIVRGLVGMASLVTVYLAYISLALGSGVPGCGQDSGCEQVLSSPWAYWLGIPVSLPGL